MRGIAIAARPDDSRGNGAGLRTSRSSLSIRTLRSHGSRVRRALWLEPHMCCRPRFQMPRVSTRLRFWSRIPTAAFLLESQYLLIRAGGLLHAVATRLEARGLSPQVVLPLRWCRDRSCHHSAARLRRCRGRYTAGLHRVEPSLVCRPAMTLVSIPRLLFGILSILRIGE